MGHILPGKLSAQSVLGLKLHVYYYALSPKTQCEAKNQITRHFQGGVVVVLTPCKKWKCLMRDQRFIIKWATFCHVNSF